MTSRWNAAIAAQLDGPYRWTVRDCIALIEAAHGVERADYMRLPEGEAYDVAVATYETINLAYSHWLDVDCGFVGVPPSLPIEPGDVAIVSLPSPLDWTLGVADDSRTIRFRAGDRMLALSSSQRICSLWRRPETR